MAGLAERRRGRPARRCAAHARGGVSHRGAGCRPRRDALRQPQRRCRTTASSSSRAAATSSPTSWRTVSRRSTDEHAPASRGTGRPAPGSAGSATTTEGFDQYVAHLIGVLPNRLDGLKVVLDEAHGAASRVSPEAFARAGAEVVTIGAEPDGLNINDGCGSTHLDLLQGRRRRARRRPRHRARRRRRPLPGRGRGRRRRSTATRSSPYWRSPCGRPGALRERHRRRHGDVQPRLQAGHGARGHRARPDRGRRPLRAGVDEGARLRARRRAVRPRHRARPRHDRRRHADRPDAGRPGRRDRPVRWPTWPASWSGCRRCWSTCPTWTGRGCRPPPSWPPRSPRRSGNWAPPDACCCAPPGTEPLVRVMVEAADIEQARAVAGRLADVVKSALG